MKVLLGLLIPFFGTTAGAACVFFMKKKIRPSAGKWMMGFASGVMVAASVWSLLIPAIDMSEEMGKFSFFPAAAGLLAGIGMLLLLDHFVPHLDPGRVQTEKEYSVTKKSRMLTLAVTLHNIPEGISTGAVFAGVLMGSHEVTMAGAFALAIGIAVQNFPEGAIISMPLCGEGMSKGKSFLYGTLSGIVEPIAGGITIVIASKIIPALPYLLSFAAGAMFYVVVVELIPESEEGKNRNGGILGFAAGFVAMMILDVALG
ncbi:MAG: ZIP family metal transporter [Eubacteriales bacterium]|nr:ZIP family metal transporter [Eubacteriales bacterium]